MGRVRDNMKYTCSNKCVNGRYMQICVKVLKRDTTSNMFWIETSVGMRTLKLCRYGNGGCGYNIQFTSANMCVNVRLHTNAETCVNRQTRPRL